MYALITAACNEKDYIERTIESVLDQTLPPAIWVIVSDGSTDGTDAIVERYGRYAFIRLLRIERTYKRDFASKVYALNEGATQAAKANVSYIGHLDADITFAPDYYSRLIEKLEVDVTLGVAGGTIYEWTGNAFSPRPLNSYRSVAGAIQMFRRDCYESLRGFQALRYGGEDWCAEVTARMNGWRVESFADLKVYHHRPTGSGTGLFRNAYRQGRMDFSLGSHPLFEIARVSRRLGASPNGISSLIRLLGYIAGHFSSEKRIVSDQFCAFLRREEMTRLWRLVGLDSRTGL